MAWRSCCKEKKPPEFSPKVVEEPKLPVRHKPPVVPVAYVLKHEEDEDEQEKKPLPIKPPVKPPEQPPVQVQVQVKVEAKPEKIEPSGEDDDVPKPSTSGEMNTIETQTNPHHFPKSSARVTLDEILRGMQRIQYIMDKTVTDFEQRISRLERIVLKMRNAWIHHRTCHLEGLEYDDEHEDF